MPPKLLVGFAPAAACALATHVTVALEHRIENAAPGCEVRRAASVVDELAAPRALRLLTSWRA
jgi:hypothetical protein